MFDKIAGSRFRKVVVAILLVVFAVLATGGGIKYYRWKSVQPVLQSKTYQTAVKLVDMERYSRVALTREQALKLLPIVRELAANPANVGNDTARNQAMLDVLNSDQKDFLNYSVIPGRQKNLPPIQIGTFAPTKTDSLTLSSQEKDILLPIFKEISQKPNADEAYLAQKAAEIKAILVAAGTGNSAGVKNSYVEINKGKSRFERDNSHFRTKDRWDEDRDNWVRRPWQSGRFDGRKGIRVYDDLLTVLLQKAYS